MPFFVVEENELNRTFEIVKTTYVSKSPGVNSCFVIIIKTTRLIIER